MIEFDASRHIYRVDGVIVPSVSEITECLHKMAYRDAPPDLMEYAAARGTAVHEATEKLDWNGEVQVNGTIAPYLKAYAKFLEAKQPEWDLIEHRVNKGLEYAGTLDRYGKFNGAYCILDIKTTSRITREIKAVYTAAQNLYRRALESWLPVEKLWILQLKQDETYKLIELPVEDTLADACLAIHSAVGKRRRSN